MVDCLNPLELFYADDPLCPQCRTKLGFKLRTGYLEATRYQYVYDYNPMFKDMLYQFKELNDVSLASSFLYPLKNQLKKLSKRYQLMTVCSIQSEMERRGYSPCQLILASLGIRSEQPFIHRGNLSQKHLKMKERGINVEQIVLNQLPKQKKVLLFDDVMTTGSTIRRCLDLLEPHIKEIRVIVLSRVNDT